MTPLRILLCGDVLGCFNQLFKRVQSVNKSAGPFDALLCVGQFFPESSDCVLELSQYLDGSFLIPMPTYFIGDYGVGAAQTLSKALVSTSTQGFKPDGIEICHNIYWLRGSGKFSLQGLSVAYLSGRQQQLLAGQAIGVYSEDDIGALRALSEDTDVIDIFLTNEWPYGISSGADIANASRGVSDASGCDNVIAELVAELKPRYHIAGTKNIFFAREPYLNDNVVHATRFIGLGSVGNKNKEKFIYALSLTPASSMAPSEISSKPPNTTSSPFKLVNEKSHPLDAAKRLDDNGDNSQYWRYNVPQKRLKSGDDKSERLCYSFTSTGSCNRGEKCNFRHDEESREHYLRDICFDFLNKGKCERGFDCRFGHRLSGEDGRKDQTWAGSTFRPNTEKNCWFCLSSPNVESHLLISIADRYYCALAKGPLVQDHALLIPVEHKPTTLFMPPEADAELGKFKTALKTCFKKLGKVVVFYESVSEHTTHANIQAVPLPSSRASHVQRAFTLASKRLGFEFTTLTPTNADDDAAKLLREQSKRSTIFFYVEMPDGSLLVNSDPECGKLPIQFGREVLAGMLNVADRADWRNCKLSKEDEIKMVDGFKNQFKEFDPAR